MTGYNSKHEEQHNINKAATSNSIVNPQGIGEAVNNSNTYIPQDIETTLISYEENCSMEPNTWVREAYLISIFRNINFLDINAKNIEILLLHIVNFIGNRKLNKDPNLI